MGTRNLVAVVKDGNYVIAQYGQWDGYPDGQGTTALHWLSDKANVARLEAALPRVREISDEAMEEILLAVGARKDPNMGFLLGMDASAKFSADYPQLSRDAGAKILELVAASTDDPFLVQRQVAFAGESLFCEWAWVVDLDKRTFEGFRGFNKSPVDASERFAFLNEKTSDGYFPVTLVASWPLDDLPEEEDFLEAFRDEDEDEEEDAA